MTDLFVPLPDSVAAGQKNDAVILAASIGCFAGIESSRAKLEYGLEQRFKPLSAVVITDITDWLVSFGAKLVNLDTSDSEALHAALQRQNANKALALLAIADASKLVELEDVGDGSGTQPHPLWNKAEPCLLLRVGYSVDQDYAYYSASLPGDARRNIKLTWTSLVAASVAAAVAILPPPAPIDHDALDQAVHILQQALSTANQAHSTILSLLGQAPGTPQEAS